MSLWARIRRVFRREAAEVEDMVNDAVDRGNAVLDEKEREMTASPEEKLRIQQQRIDQTDAEFDEIRRRIGRTDE